MHPVFLYLVIVFSLCGLGCHSRRLFLIPLRWHGPNNHVTTIKETLSLSKLLPKSKIAIPNLQEHKFSDGAAHQMLSAELFDLRALRKSNVSYILLDDLRERWDGELDMILYFRDDEFPKVNHMALELNLTAPDEHNWLRSPVSKLRGCSLPQVELMREMVAPHHYVGIVSYNDFAPDTHKLAGTLLMDCGENLCCQAYKEQSVLLRKSPQLHALAKELISKRLHNPEGFVAGHIRPMPDPCIQLWESPKKDLSQQELWNTCRTDFLYSRFVPNLQVLQRLYNTTNVFILSHPLIRHRVTRMLKAGGIHPVFIDISDLRASIAASETPLKTPLSVSLLAMVEEAVATAATAFLGTAESSMTGMIVQERLAAGLAPDSIYFISPHPSCTMYPCKLLDHYDGTLNNSVLYKTHR